MPAKIAFSLLALQGASAAPRSYTKYAGYNCTSGSGGTPLSNDPVPLQTEAKCGALCDENLSCVAFSRDSPSHALGTCRMWLAYDLGACTQAQDMDFYSLEVASLEQWLQEQATRVLEPLLPYYPTLSLSAAWKDAEREVAAAAGKVRGRETTTDDTFLYGSGTKPVTAVSIMRLIESGKVKFDDKIVTYLDPYLQKHGRPFLAETFGTAVVNSTVLQLIRMTAGIRDFEDDFSYDAWVLGNGSKFWSVYDAIDFSVSKSNIQAGEGDEKMVCKPDECSSYSSTSYVMAGLLLASVLNPDGDWFEFDLATAAFEDRALFPGMAFPPMGRGDSNLSHYLTVPGSSIAPTWPTTTILYQDPSILGWTCGSMVASPKGVAKYFYHTLAPEGAHADSRPLLSDAARNEMFRTVPLSKGWAKGMIHYGAGIMDLAYGDYRSHKMIGVKGHEGDTYGFLSSSGYVPELQGTYSVASNVDEDTPMEVMTCVFLQSVQQFKRGFNHTLKCALPSGESDGAHGFFKRPRKPTHVIV